MERACVTAINVGICPANGRQKFEASESSVHHRGIIKEIGRIKEIGVETWAEEQDKFWRCPDCGTETHWYLPQCSKCGRDLSEHTPFLKMTKSPEE